MIGTALSLGALSAPAAPVFALVAGAVSFIAISRFVEQKADRDACRGNPKAQDGAIQFFELLQNCQKGLRNQGNFFTRIKYDAEGNNRFDR